METLQEGELQMDLKTGGQGGWRSGCMSVDWCRD